LLDLVKANDAGALAEYKLVFQGNDTINGSNYSDILVGYGPNETFKGNGGNDKIMGGAGINTAVYQGNSSQYAIAITGTNSGAISDQVANRDGQDLLTNVSRLHFTNDNVALDIGANQAAGNAYMLYQAAFNRTPDAVGLGYWINALDHGADVINGVANAFISSPEFQNTYGANCTNAQFVDRLYHNVLHRAGEAEGVAFWNNALDNHIASRAAVLEGFAVSPENVGLVGQAIAHGIHYTPWGN
jgi:hypothetical protein